MMEFSLALTGRIVLQPGLLTMDRCVIAPGGPPAASKALTVAQATLLGLLLVDREPPGAMTPVHGEESGLRSDFGNP